MVNFDRTILDFYQLPTPFPTKWPAEKDAHDSSGDDERGPGHARRSRYQAMEKAFHNRRSILSGPDGGNLVQKDEPDPLGSSDSVVRSLTCMGLLLQDDVRMHSDTRSLLKGLDLLSQSIDQNSASLKVLVESNFERFVRAKATIDNVYKEMKYRATDPAQARGGRYSRHAGRNSFRHSGNRGPRNPLALAASDGRKNALVKESEFGLLGIKVPLLDVSAKAEEVWGPARGGRDKEENLKIVANYLDQFKDYAEVSALVCDSIKRKDYESLVEANNRARKFADEARRLSRELAGRSPTDAQLYQIVLAGRVWNDVEKQVQSFKKEVWKKLMSLQTASKAESRSQDQHMDIIGLLLELGAEENPIHLWLATRYEKLKGKVQAAADRSKVEIEVFRRRLAASDKPPPQAVALHLLSSLGRQSIEGRQPSSDSADVIELWEKMLAFLSSLISSQGILGELVDFWKTVQGFIEGKTQRILPLGYNGESRHHHQLSRQAVADLDKGVVEMVELLREHVHAFFAGPPPEDISLLFSPLPLSPNSPASASALSPTALRDPRFNFDPENPPPSPKRGELWEKLAFWPPRSNSINGAHYLSRMLALVGSGASDMACIGPVATRDPQLLDHLKSLVGISRERCVTALCAAWNADAENIKYVEDWQRAPGSKDVTRMPADFASFEGALLLGMQKILYVPEAIDKADAANIFLPPPPKLLQMVRSQYVTTLYKALSGMVENAERSDTPSEDEWAAVQDGWNAVRSTALVAGKSAFDVGDRNVRMLLTLRNMQALRSQVVPKLNSQFENAFSVKLTNESMTIRDVFGQIDARLFQSYTKPSVERLQDIIQAGLSAPDWLPAPKTRPQTAKPYVYETLLALVLVHSQVSTTAPSLTAQVLSFLLEQTSQQILDALRRRRRYSLEALMQATLDVEFIAQTLSHYTTDRASELQSQIYQELDGRTDNDVRARLQNELPEMCSVLKKLREASKSEFSCFKKARRHSHGGSKPDDTASAGG